MDRVIVGLTGPTAGGKGTVANFLKEKGYTYFSLSDRIRDEANKRGWSIRREVLQDLGDELRTKEGPETLARRTSMLPEFRLANKIVIDSIRHPSEIDFLRDIFDAEIVGVTASEKTRFELMLLRGREGDPKTFDEFLRLERREQGESGTPAMQVKKCLEMTDYIIYNESGLEYLREVTEGIVTNIESGVNRIKRERE